MTKNKEDEYYTGASIASLPTLPNETLDQILTDVVRDDPKDPNFADVARNLENISLVNKSLHQFLNHSDSPVAELNRRRQRANTKLKEFVRTGPDAPEFETRLLELVPYSDVLTDKQKEPVRAVVSERFTKVMPDRPVQPEDGGYEETFRDVLRYAPFFTHERKTTC